MNQQIQKNESPLSGFADPLLAEMAEKIEAGERLTREEGIRLFQTPDLLGLGWLANRERERRHGNKTYYNINRHINYSNICVNHCKFCAFARRPDEKEGQWQYSLDEIFDRAIRDMPPGGSELHIVGGLHPDLQFEYYIEMLRGINKRLPYVHLKAFTAIEIAHLVKISGLKLGEVFDRLIAAGLGSLPGGGAEVLNPGSRALIAGDKLTGKGWLNVHRVAHQKGLRTNCTLLYGHVETVEDRVDHMLQLRALQDETGGFQVFIPLAFHPKFSHMQEVPGPSGVTDLKTIAVARLLLDNIPHIKAYWIMLGVKAAQLAQHFGANDLDGTVVEETIYHMAGAESPQGLSVKELRNLIREAGREPVLRDTLYNELPATGENGGVAAERAIGQGR
jgi:aminodeoxyfutalosine synthase